MKLKIGDYEVDIRARHNLSDVSNRKDTFDFLNHLAVNLMYAEKYNKQCGCANLVKQNVEEWKSIMNFLKTNNYYKI